MVKASVKPNDGQTNEVKKGIALIESGNDLFRAAQENYTAADKIFTDREAQLVKDQEAIRKEQAEIFVQKKRTAKAKRKLGKFIV